MPNRKGFWKWLTTAGMMVLLLSGCGQIKSGVLNPQGPVAQKQYDLILWSSILMLIILVVVFALFVLILIKYRARPENEGYEPPDEEGNTFLEIVWTVIPVIIVIALAIPTVTTTFDLEKSPSPDKKPMTIEVTSAQWKWIFKYPEQGIETVNYVKIPENVPIRFRLTSNDAMNSFWVPELGGQKYTMADMPMYLWLEADKPGEYLGRGANFTGREFAKMEFEVEAEKQADFDNWVKQVKATAPAQTEKAYQKLLKPGTVDRQTFSSYPKSAETGDESHSHGSHKGSDDMEHIGDQREESSDGDHHHH
ncbi:cytochrome aa3 quinol oxidase subunit II [Salinithrix halophila]|uniref:Quinol oxidase subunit 2 n=1 Tax=Salinithrix halophila TaxID=1485204 RepID=A0ABV8JGB2_9BACL